VVRQRSAISGYSISARDSHTGKISEFLFGSTNWYALADHRSRLPAVRWQDPPALHGIGTSR
jgi:hypothetical protein